MTTIRKFLDNFGIEKAYPHIRKIWSKLADFFALCRPFTLLGAWIAGFFLDLLFSKPSIDLIHSFLVGMTLALIQAGGQAVNQSVPEEIEIDRINGKGYRPTVSGRMSLKEGKMITCILFIMGSLLAFSMNVYYGIFSLLIIFFATAYTTRPLRVKRVFLVNNVWQGIARGMLPAVYVSLAYTRFGLLPILFGIVLVIWVTGAQTSKDFGDEAGDREFGIKTFPVVLGRDTSLKVMGVLMGISFIVLNLFIYIGVFPQPFILLNVLVAPSALIISSLQRQIKFKYAENSLGWVGFYSALGLWYILPSLLIA